MEDMRTGLHQVHRGEGDLTGECSQQVGVVADVMKPNTVAYNCMIK